MFGPEFYTKKDLNFQETLDIYMEWGNENYLELNANKTKAMLEANKGKLKSVVDPAPFNVGNNKIMFVSRFVNLGSTLDSELTLEPLYKNACRKVDKKIISFT